jgi:(p)ppGpp synthase/HD superfamily hydrolase
MGTLLGEVIALVSEAFANDVDKGGRPYVLHCFAVMENARHMGVDSDVYLAAAFAHDLKEDKPDYMDRLVNIAMKYNRIALLSLVDALTRRPDESYRVFIDRIVKSQNVRLIKIKKGDIKHNSSLTRLKGVTENDINRMKKYQISYLELDRAQKLLENN